MTMRGSVSIVLAGEAGQGIQTVENIVTRLLKLSGYHVFASKEYMSRVRGGNNTTEIRVSSISQPAFVEAIDILLPLGSGWAGRLHSRISGTTVVIGETAHIAESSAQKKHAVEFSQIATTLGNTIYANTVAAGVICGIFGINRDILSAELRRMFGKKGDEVVKKNVEAANAGYAAGQELKLVYTLEKDATVTGDILVNGSSAVALGAIAGGCNFISSYPMSPSTGVLTFLAQQAGRFGIVAEQAEDEISAINMALGAWYAGARAMVSTSGGGFALMEEAVSLSGITETPVVIHLAQRPGPATGLPTRTEQGDLEFALYAGHGEFPRIMLAPGSLEDAFYLAAQAFNLADKHQVPVFILTDQYLMDSYYNIKDLDLSSIQNTAAIIETPEDYKRYRITETGISPRGIPGFGKGLVCVDSDEHDEDGRITEDSGVRTAMVEKRLRKAAAILTDALAPDFFGAVDYTTLVIGWGSTRHVIKEALENLNISTVAYLHFKQVYPLHGSIVEYLRKATKTVIIENNATSQFGRLIKIQTGREIDHKILQYNGMPFSVEELQEKLKKVI